MIYYIYLAVAVIVIIGIGVVGIMLIRRGRRAADEVGRLSAPVSDAAAEPAAEPALQPELQPAAAASGPAPAPAASLVDPQQNYLQGVEQLLEEWRARHELAAVQAASRPPARCDGPAAASASAIGPGPAGGGSASDHAAAPEPAAVPGAAPAPAPAADGYGVWPADPAAAQGMMLADPLGMVILDLVDGKGKLTGSEVKRLEVFRPDRIKSAVRSIQFPPRLQSDEEAAMRLAQIQLYAASLELRSKWAGDLTRRPGVSDVPLTTRDFKLKIARDILDLPQPDRNEVIGYLLGGLLGSPNSGTTLKRAIIDTLEHLRSASLTNVLLDCLDDPDPIVQEYALAAADRLLDG